MFISKDSIIINSISIGQYLTEVKYGYHKQWASDTGRNTLSGNMSGTLLGIYPKLTLKFRKLTQAEIEIITPILDSASQSLTYYDPTKKANITIATYTGDYEIVNKQIISGNAKNDGFECSFIAKNKRV